MTRTTLILYANNTTARQHPLHMTDPGIFLAEHSCIDYSSSQTDSMWMSDTAMTRPEREDGVTE